MVAASCDQQGTILDMVNMFSGGALSRLSLFALGVMPYISASIIIQMMAQVMPSLQELRKEGESGRRKITQYTRYGTVVLASFQSFAAAADAAERAAGRGLQRRARFRVHRHVTMTTGTMFLMWLGEQITERGIGNGISMIILAGIVAGLPGAVGRTLEQVAAPARWSWLDAHAGAAALVLGVTAFVVFVERAQRRITVNYAKRQVGRKCLP